MKRPRKPVRIEKRTIVEEGLNFTGKVENIINMLEQYRGCEIDIQYWGYDGGHEHNIVKVDTESDESFNKRVKEYEKKLRKYREYRKKKKVYEDKIKELEESMKEA